RTPSLIVAGRYKEVLVLSGHLLKIRVVSAGIRWLPAPRRANLQRQRSVRIRNHRAETGDIADTSRPIGVAADVHVEHGGAGGHAHRLRHVEVLFPVIARVMAAIKAARAVSA